MTTKIEDVVECQEILDRIINYSWSAKRSLENERDAAITIGFIKAQVRRLEELANGPRT